jgi:glucose-6-phosphate 1-dehydrogenase
VIQRFVILGASGDLTSRYLMPALARLMEAGKLGDVEVVGVALEDWTTEGFRERVAGGLERHAGGVSKEAHEGLLNRLRYAQSDVTDAGTLRGAVEPEKGPVVAYLALPPTVFAPTLAALRELGLADGSRVVVEKPFGTSLADAQGLNRLLHDSFAEEAVFRIDHFLGKQKVQNILGVRFANRLFEPLWNCNHIGRVEIRWDETLALEGRAGYYDRAGALKDMLQNHLLQLLALVAMEPPLSLGARDLRDRKVDVLRAVRSLSPEEVLRLTVRARYGAGELKGREVKGREVPAYVDEEGVAAENDTETFAQVTLFIDNWRWSGVPFTLRSGKALAKDRAEIAVYFRPVPHLAFGQEGDPRANALRIAFAPDRMALDLNINGPGDPFVLEPAALALELAPQDISAYGKLLLDVLAGDPTLSIRDDEAEEAWRIMEPILAVWQEGRVPLLDYPAGSPFEPQPQTAQT